MFLEIRYWRTLAFFGVFRHRTTFMTDYAKLRQSIGVLWRRLASFGAVWRSLASIFGMCFLTPKDAKLWRTLAPVGVFWRKHFSGAKERQTMPK